MMKHDFGRTGEFILGSNYWASNAGTAMWSDWQPEVVDHDLKILSEHGVKMLRVFPLWSDFQPIDQLYTVSNKPKEIRHGETILSDDENGKAGMSEEALARFEAFTNIAEKYGITLVVGLITGWMSGRCFVPTALQGKNLLTDPTAIKWEVRFVKQFVKRFMKKECIVAWDLGNEINAMSPVPDRDTAWLWTALISNTIKSLDSGRPVISGMHGLTVDSKWHWTIEDQSELTDVLTTHPYPIFTPHCNLDPINTMRTLLHASSQTRFYSDIGGKPCFVEEQGTLGPMFSDDEVDAAFMRANLFSLYAHDCRGMMWWCNHEQVELERAPYDWIAMETELGLFRSDNTPKPVVQEISTFEKVMKGLPFDTLPSRIIDGVCILSETQDQWGAAYSSFVLAKQAGIDIEYQSSEQPLKDASVYMLPSISGTASIRKHRWQELMKKIEDGATLYISCNDGFLSGFEKHTGMRVHTREQRRGASQVTFDCFDQTETLPLDGSIKLTLQTSGAEVLAKEADGNPAFSCFNYGKGKVYFLNFPLETYMTKHPGIFHDENAGSYWKVYKEIFSKQASQKAVAKQTPTIGITEHPIDSNQRVVIMINYSPKEVTEEIVISSDYKITDILHGSDPKSEQDKKIFNIKGNDAVILLLSR